VSEVEFLPAWYPRRRKRRVRLLMLAASLVAIFVLGFAVQWLWT
jgi:hypothetical protein